MLLPSGGVQWQVLLRLSSIMYSFVGLSFEIIWLDLMKPKPTQARSKPNQTRRPRLDLFGSRTCTGIYSRTRRYVNDGFKNTDIIITKWPVSQHFAQDSILEEFDMWHLALYAALHYPTSRACNLILSLPPYVRFVHFSFDRECFLRHAISQKQKNQDKKKKKIETHS